MRLSTEALRVTLACGVLGAASVASGASITTFNSPSEYFAALSNPTVLAFEAPALGTVFPEGSGFSGITFTDFPDETFGGLITDQFAAFGNQSLSVDRDGEFSDFFFEGESFSVAFDAPVNAVGLFFNIVPADDVEDFLFISTPVGDAFGGGADPVGITSFFFVGLISDTPFSSATFGSTVDAPGGFNVDDLSFQVVPIPGALWLLAGGLLALTTQRRKG
ncbi:MAG: hypothetical protein AAF184_04600 [Pseudomonadota bacterium]